MSRREGLVAVDRGIFDHGIFADEAFTEREAWLWLIAEAAWAPRRIRVGTVMVGLARGQLTHSVRFMAEKWKWSKSRVSRFLSMLEGEKMIRSKNGTDDGIGGGTEDGTARGTVVPYGQNIITICNYDKFQNFERYWAATDGTDDGTDDGTANGTDRGTILGQRETKDYKDTLSLDAGARENPVPGSLKSGDDGAGHDDVGDGVSAGPKTGQADPMDIPAFLRRAADNPHSPTRATEALIPSDWRPGDDDLAHARMLAFQSGVPDDVVDWGLEAAKFVSHHRSLDRRFTAPQIGDAFRKWAANAVGHAKTRPARAKPATGSAGSRTVAEAFAAMDHRVMGGGQ